jgi:hypothetical protein
MPTISKLIADADAGVAGELRMLTIREHRFPFLRKAGTPNPNPNPNPCPCPYPCPYPYPCPCPYPYPEPEPEPTPNKVGNWNRYSARTGGTLVEKCCHVFDP